MPGLLKRSARIGKPATFFSVANGIALALALAPLAPVPHAVAQTPPQPVSSAPVPIVPSAPDVAATTPRFDIERYDVQGNTLLKPEVIARAVAPFVGKAKDFADVQRALEALQNVYQAAGYAVVQVTLPEQELDKGTVLFRVIETRIGTVSITGNKFFDNANIRASVPALQEGGVPNSRDVAASIRAANENPSKQTTVVLKAGAREGEVDAEMRVTDEKFWRGSLNVDNTGTGSTGVLRAAFALQYANLFNLDHVVTAQYITAPEKPDEVKIFGLGYRIPVYARGDTIDLVGGYSSVNSGNVSGGVGFPLFSVSGSGTVLGMRYNHMLPRWKEVEHRLTAGLDYKAYSNRVVQAGTPGTVVPDITLTPISLTYTGSTGGNDWNLGFFASASQNFPLEASRSSEADFRSSRADARAGYRIYRYGANFLKQFPTDVQVKVGFNGQYSEHALVSPEQFGIGGFENVRGMYEREFSNDRGYRLNLEAYTPDFASKLGWTDFRARVMIFLDSATTSRNSVQPGEQSGFSATSWGLGLRLQYRKEASFRIDFGEILDGNGASERGDKRIHAAFAYTF